MPPDPDDRYDLVHVRARPWAGERPRTAGLVDFEFEFQGESLTLEIARSRRRALERHGITVLIIPVRYREPALSAGEARGRAEQAMRVDAVEDCSRRAGAPRLHAEHPMFFTFLAPDDAAERAGGSPGRLIAVDRCDGHVWTEEETNAYFALIGAR